MSPGDVLVAAYSLGDAIRTLLVFLAWIAFLGFGFWLLVAAVRNRAVSLWIKVLLVLLIIVLPPVGFLGCLAFWLDTRKNRYPTVWESALRQGVVTGPAEVHRLDGSVVIVEPGQRFEP
jgi:hypothetical protein